MPTGDWTREALRDERGRIIGRGGAPAQSAEAVSQPAAVGAPRAGIERELVVIGRCANPKLVRAYYFELAERRVCLVDVKRNAKWVKGMRFRMVEPFDEAAYVAPWVYVGKAPRLRGRW